MKLLMAVYAIRFIVTLMSNKTKANNENKKDADDNVTTHPAAFRVR
jgi:hypothetical protein